MSSSKTYGVILKIQAKDGVSKVMNNIASNGARSSNKLGKSFNKTFGGIAKYGKLMGAIMSAKVISRGFAVTEKAVLDVATSFVELDQSLTNASVKFNGMADRGSAGWENMSTIVKELGKTTEFTASEVAQGLDFMAMAGFNYTQSLEMMPKMIDLATVAQIDLARASDIASDAIGAFGLDKTGKDMQRVSDVFSKTVTTSNTTMETLFDTMKMSGAAVTTAGGDMETWAALTGKMGSAGIKGTRAATAIKNAYMRLADPVGKAKGAMKLLKVEAVDGKGDMRDMVDILQDMEGALKNVEVKDKKGNLKDFATVMKEARKLGTGEKLKAISQIFGKRAAVGVASLLQNGISDLRTYRDMLYDVEGASTEAAAKTRKGLGVQLKLLDSAKIAKGYEIIAGLIGSKGTDPAELVGDLVTVLRAFDVTPIVSGLKSVYKYAKLTFNLIKDNWGLIKTIVAGGVLVKMGFFMKNMVGATVHLAKGWASIMTNMAAYALKSSGAGLASQTAINAARGGIFGTSGVAGTIGGGTAAGVSTAAGAGVASTGANIGTVLGTGVGKMAGMGAAGLAVIVVSVLTALAGGVAVGMLIRTIMGTDTAEDNQLRRQDKLGNLVSGKGVKGLKGASEEQLKYKLSEVNRLEKAALANEGDVFWSEEERSATLAGVAEFRKLALIEMTKSVNAQDVQDAKNAVQGDANKAQARRGETDARVGWVGQSSEDSALKEALTTMLRSGGEKSLEVNVNIAKDGSTTAMTNWSNRRAPKVDKGSLSRGPKNMFGGHDEVDPEENQRFF